MTPPHKGVLKEMAKKVLVCWGYIKTQNNLFIVLKKVVPGIFFITRWTEHKVQWGLLVIKKSASGGERWSYSHTIISGILHNAYALVIKIVMLLSQMNKNTHNLSK